MPPNLIALLIQQKILDLGYDIIHDINYQIFMKKIFFNIFIENDGFPSRGSVVSLENTKK